MDLAKMPETFGRFKAVQMNLRVYRVEDLPRPGNDNFGSGPPSILNASASYWVDDSDRWCWEPGDGNKCPYDWEDFEGREAVDLLTLYGPEVLTLVGVLFHSSKDVVVSMNVKAIPRDGVAKRT